MENNKTTSYSIETRCIHGPTKPYDQSGAVSVPIYQSATFAHLGVGKSTGYDYSRLQNPTRDYTEQLVCQLESGVDAIAFSTGMAAITSLMELFEPGDHIIASDDLYGGSLRLFNHISTKNGLSFSFVNTSDLTAICDRITPRTKAIFIETPTNPMMHVTDIEAVSSIATSNNALLIVDNTFLTPYFQQPLTLGADIVIHSGTKFLGGHNDTLAGFLVTSSEVLSERLRFLAKTVGACLSPMDSWLIQRGIKTLALRMERQQANALAISQWLESHPKVEKVYYAGLPSNPGYDTMCKQTSGFGSMISVTMISKEAAYQLLEHTRLIQFAESLGGVETLITYPMTQTHADVPEAERERKGITDCLLRLSIGIEHVNDLITDLTHALKED